MLNDGVASFGMLAIGIALFALWLFTLVFHLKRTDYSDTDKIIWTIVLCTLNILGVVLYFLFAPAGKYRVLTERELKDKFNQGKPAEQ